MKLAVELRPDGVAPHLSKRPLCTGRRFAFSAAPSF